MPHVGTFAGHIGQRHQRSGCFTAVKLFHFQCVIMRPSFGALRPWLQAHRSRAFSGACKFAMIKLNKKYFGLARSLGCCPPLGWSFGAFWSSAGPSLRVSSCLRRPGCHACMVCDRAACAHLLACAAFPIRTWAFTARISACVWFCVLFVVPFVVFF